jgi:hypothetical protein
MPALSLPFGKAERQLSIAVENGSRPNRQKTSGEKTM